ncbi:hypothetical protein CXR04_10765 [Streptomyces sp. CMB-StM0423]|nr:hypothetical protein CXR04_10765 [Streptomyces sp. CMB-StM0423]
MAARIGETMRALGDVHQELSTWWWEDREEPVDPESPWLHDTAVETRWENSGKRSGEGVGYNLWFHSNRFPDYHSGPGPDGMSSLSFRAGESAIPRLGNAVSLSLPLPEHAPDGLYDPGAMRKAVHWVAEIWRPDHALCGTRGQRDAQGNRMKVSPKVGWITYLGPPYTDGIERAGLPHGVQAAARAGGALLWFPLPVEDVTPGMVVDLREALVAAGCLPGNG